MAVKERILGKLKTVGDILLAPGKDRPYPAASEALTAARDWSRKGLPGDCFAPYAEIYDGLLPAFHQLATGALDVREVLPLCQGLLHHLSNLTKEEWRFKRELVFLPYKVTMWDSLESVWRAAVADEEHCLPYVIPIPYCDRNPDGTAKEWHLEASRYPKDVPVLDWQSVDLAEMRPDAIFIHNPYDDQNRVTSVESRYYSRNLKPLTKLLIYIPYFSTTGGMMEGQKLCAAYEHADYIVVQAEKLSAFIDPSIPKEKILPFGSPKFDKVLRLCQNPPAPPPAWRKKLKGRRVYFYNTSLGGMLGNTEAFLQKMKYVFDCFRGKENACLLWRPHPLLDSTFESMRREFLPEFEKLKSYYIEKQIGIFDDTPEIEDSIALSDAYIGDSATSVTSLFGLAGKPMFIFNNLLHTPPAEDDWRGAMNWGINLESKDWIITQGNKLYHAPNHDYHYRFYCDLSEYAHGGYYTTVWALNGKVYAFPGNAQDILVIGDHKIERRIPLNHHLEKAGAFRGPVHIGHYLFLLPILYPAIVRFDLETERIDYIEGLNDTIVRYVNEEWRVGGCAIWGDLLLLASPVSQQVIAIHSETLTIQSVIAGNPQNQGGCLAMLPDGDDFWMVPYIGRVVTRWNPKKNEAREYDAFPEGFLCHYYPFGYPCEDKPFTGGLADEEYVYLPPYWGNQYVRIHKETGVAEKWDAPFPVDIHGKNGYFFAGSTGGFGYLPDKKEILFWYAPARQWYRYDAKEKTFTPLDVTFDVDDLKQHVDGFREESEWFRYGCMEDAFNTLPDFIDGKITGSPHDKARQIRAFEAIAANPDGTAGEKIYQFTINKLTTTALD